MDNLLLTCICLHICKMGLIKTSSCRSISELFESMLCVALGIQCEQCPLDLVVLHSELCGTWLSVCCFPLVLSWLALFLFHALVLQLGCMPHFRWLCLPQQVCQGQTQIMGLKHSLIVDSITTGPTGTLLCFLSSLRSPSRSGAQEPGDAFEPEQTRE